MTSLQSVLAVLKRLGILGGPSWLLWLQFGLPLVILVGGFLLARSRARKRGEAAGPPPRAKTKDETAARPYRLKQAWRRFLAQLPALVRRSILNFEHFVVLGAASSGKTHLVERHTDWRRQTRQFAANQSLDPDLQLYLTSSAVVMELPARILEDHGEKSRHALNGLWKAAFRRRSPIVLVTVDATRLLTEAPDEADDLAGALRSKINLLSMVRRRPVEVRVVLTHLDKIDGFVAFSRTCNSHQISTRIGIGQEQSKIAVDLENWLEDIRGHFPRALTSAGADEFRSFVSFVRKMPELVPTLSRFLGLLFAHESLAPNPTPGGLYLSSSSAGINNPFHRASREELGPDPRRRHVLTAAVAASLVLAYFIAAYRVQWTHWTEARRGWEFWQAAAAGGEDEREARDAISAFAHRRTTIVQRYPDFFGEAAENMRARFSERIREDLLIPRLRQTAIRGSVRDGAMSLPMRRSLYHLGLIHSDTSDRLRILDPKRLSIWASMTELEPDVIVDYVKSTDTAHRRPVSFETNERALDPRDGSAPWASLLHRVNDAISAGVVRKEELRELQAQAGELLQALGRFDHDDLTTTILPQLDAGSASGRETRQIQLGDAYSPKFGAFLKIVEASNLLGQREQLEQILRAIRGAAIDEAEAPLLRPLLDRLSLLYRAEGASGFEASISVRLDGEEIVFDAKKWAALIRDSRASEQIGQFVRARVGEHSIFFDPDMDAQLRPIVWNPTNDGSALFMGKATIEGRYTRAAFQAHVADGVLRLSELLSKAPIPDEEKQQLEEHVREHLRRYAAEYRAQLLRFYRSFSLRSESQEALRVVLAQIVGGQSPLDDFLTAFERNTRLPLEEPMLEPMREAVLEFAPLHAVLNEESGAPELAKYKSILGQLLADLGPAQEPPVASEANPLGNESLEKTLSPAGRLELANLRGDAGSYASLVKQWMDSVGLPEYQRLPFTAPLERLAELGRRDIEQAVSRVWERNMKPDLQRLGSKFPFDPEAQDEAVPKDIISVLHPETGKLFDLFRRYIEPISEVADGSPFRERRTMRGRLSLPAEMYPMLNAAAGLSARLWDSTGKAKPIELKVATVPFEHGPNPRSALTLVYLNAGEASVFNFNQKPGIITVKLDWTREHSSQVGIQLTSLDSKENQFPEPIVVEGSFWSLLRLLKKAEALPVKQPANAMLYSWAIRHRREGSEKTNARFVLLGDPWEALGRGKLFRNQIVLSKVVD